MSSTAIAKPGSAVATTTSPEIVADVNDHDVTLEVDEPVLGDAETLVGVALDPEIAAACRR
jgi:proteasome assembly chaperone (PAC2) family protein